MKAVFIKCSKFDLDYKAKEIPLLALKKAF